MIEKLSASARLRYDAFEAFQQALPILKGWISYRPGGDSMKSNFPRRESGGYSDSPLDCASIVESVIEGVTPTLQKAVKDYLKYSAREGVLRTKCELEGEDEAYRLAIIEIAEHGRR